MKKSERRFRAGKSELLRRCQYHLQHGAVLMAPTNATAASLVDRDGTQTVAALAATTKTRKKTK